jgi:hypothetical protein
MDSTFAGLLLGLRKRFAAAGGSVYLAARSDGCRQTMKQMHLDALFTELPSAAPQHVKQIACPADGLRDAAMIDLMLRAHAELAALDEENQRVFGPIVAMLTQQAQQRPTR